MNIEATYKKGGVTYWKEFAFDPPKPLKFRNCLGEVLREERLAQGKTLRSIKTLSTGHVSEIERGVKEMSSEVLEVFCHNLDISIAEILRRTANKMEQ